MPRTLLYLQHVSACGRALLKEQCCNVLRAMSAACTQGNAKHTQQKEVLHFVCRQCCITSACAFPVWHRRWLILYT